jgi:hypothetical protein
LLMVYTHPIDSSGTRILENDGVGPYQLGVPFQQSKDITQPSLGLIHGAGVGIRRTADNRIDLETKRIYDGKLKILANLNDHTDGGSNTGIKLRNGAVIHGSFPSPDDLANIAPNLSLELADNNFQLIGQTALPIAYVVTTKDQDNLVQTDIIDIRPFMRTAEMSYNERAGVAAAQPPLSLANPAVGAAQLSQVVETINDRIRDPGTGPAGPAGPPGGGTAGVISHVYSDYIMGGLAWGVEGSLLTMNESAGGPWTQTAGGQSPGSRLGFFSLNRTYKRRNFLKGLWEGQVAKGGSFAISEWLSDGDTGTGTKGKYLGLPENRIIPLLPEWQPQITEETAQAERNQYIGDAGDAGASPYSWMWTAPGTGQSFPSPGMDRQTAGVDTWADKIYYITKKFRIRMPGGASNFTFNADYANCFPWDDNTATNRPTLQNNNLPLGNNLGIVGGRYSPIMISKSGVYADATDNQVVDVDVIIPYPIQGIKIPGGSSNDAYDLWGAGYRTMSCNHTWSSGWGSDNMTRNFQSTWWRGTNSTPMYKLGICHYPTVQFTINFHGMETLNTLTPTTAVGGVAEGVAAPSNNYYWWTDTRIPPYYDQTIIDLTGGTPVPGTGA